ncbi:MAG: mechanosensitive ion channel family protein [Candidatus Sumerlaeota bacterium]
MYGAIARYLMTAAQNDGDVNDRLEKARSFVENHIATAHDFLSEKGFSESLTRLVVYGGLFLLVLLLCVIANSITKKIIVVAIQKFVKRSKTKLDDVLLNRGVFKRFSHLVPAVVIFVSADLLFAGVPTWANFMERAAVIYMILVGIIIVDAVLNALHDIYGSYEVSRRIPIKGFIQVIKLVIVIVGIILVLSQIMGKEPWFFLSGLGALTAVIMLIFKDAILGFVAGIQLTTNNMVQPGDWIEMSDFGADGDVIDVSLTTVKVQNWDKTITMIPTYALVSNSFRNWRGMSESGGRRIMRSINLDMNTVRFCDQDMLERFKKIQYIREYIDRKLEEIQKHNKDNQVDESSLANGRHLTNLGTFRAYVEAYLRRHPQIHQDMTFLVRQLEPGPEGIPIQIYVFSKDQIWAHYEGIQADIFDHILAVIPQFDLRVFQSPTGGDFRGIFKTGQNSGENTKSE